MQFMWATLPNDIAMSNNLCHNVYFIVGALTLPKNWFLDNKPLFANFC